MVILNPTSVRFGDECLEGVTSVTIDRVAERELVEWSDLGPHVVLADTPEQRVNARLVQSLQRGTIESPRPGDMATLSFLTQGDDQSRVEVSATAVVTRVTHAVRDAGKCDGFTRTIELVLVSSDGSADPVSLEAQ